MNPISNDELRHTTVVGVADLDTPLRFKRVLADDAARREIKAKIEPVVKAYRDTFGAEPNWIRVSYDIVTRNGSQLFVDGQTYMGLLFRIMLEENNCIEVGASSIERNVFNEKDEQDQGPLG